MKLLYFSYFTFVRIDLIGIWSNCYGFYYSGCSNFNPLATFLKVEGSHMLAFIKFGAIVLASIIMNEETISAYRFFKVESFNIYWVLLYFHRAFSYGLLFLL